jgi:hypothetical protein
MVRTFSMLSDHVVQVIIALDFGARYQFTRAQVIKGRLRKNLSCQSNGRAKIDPVLLDTHIVKGNLGGILWVG